MSGVGRRVVVLAVAAVWAATTWSVRSSDAQDGTSAHNAAVHGRITLLMSDGSTAPAQDAVVWLPGAARMATAAMTARPSMASEEKRFAPHVVAVPTGTTVEFPNVDKVFHNAFSVSPGNQFDLGLYRKGASKSVTFATPGVVRVYCNIHQDMAGYVVVVAPGATALTDATGAYRLSGLRPGKQPIRVWHEMTGEAEDTVDLAAGQDGTWELRLDARRYRREPHLNKDGKPYPPVKRDADRY
jgi:plastocyanin